MGGSTDLCSLISSLDKTAAGDQSGNSWGVYGSCLINTVAGFISRFDSYRMVRIP